TVAMVCHGELAKDRPAPEHLTEFYLWLAVGGALGGTFNALIAPLVFRSVAEYPIAAVLACMMVPPRRPPAPRVRERVLDFVLPALLAGLVLLFGRLYGAEQAKVTTISVVLLFAILAFPLLAMAARPLRFGLGLGAILLVSPGALTDRFHQLYAE